MGSSFTRFLDHIQLDTPQSVGLLWTSDQLVAETSTRQHTTLTTDRHPYRLVGFEPTISAGERPQTYNLDRAATGIKVYIKQIITFHNTSVSSFFSNSIYITKYLFNNIWLQFRNMELHGPISITHSLCPIIPGFKSWLSWLIYF